MTSNRLLPEFQDFLLSRKLVPEKNVPFHPRWVSRFLAFSNKNNSLPQDALVGGFLSSLKSQRNLSDWQLRQAEEALGLYLSHFEGSKTLKELRGSTRPGRRLSDFPHFLEEMRRLIRLKHYSYSTERTYLEWAKRFLARLRFPGIAYKSVLGKNLPLTNP